MIIQFIQSAHFTPGRGGHKPLWIFIHTMETPESQARAKQVATWFAGHDSPRASAHYCVDDKQIFQCVKESDTAWSVDDFDTNQKSISIELAGTASQTIAQWQDAYSKAQMILTQELVADICKRNAIPLRRITPAYINSDSPGIGGHVDVTQAKKIAGGHTDPGINYPYLTLIAGAKKIKNGTVPTVAKTKPRPTTPSPLAPKPVAVDDGTGRGRTRIEEGIP